MTEQTILLPKNAPRDNALARLIRCIHALPAEKEYEISWKLRRRTRSIQQCRYLNGIAYKLLSDHTGYERDDISEYLCGTYFGWREKKVPRKPGVTGPESVPLRTTTRNEDGKRDVLSWADFDDYVAFVQRFGAEHGIFIPDPDPELRKT